MRAADFLQTLRHALVRDRLRVALTMAGIAVGAFAVAMLVSLGTAIQTAIGRSLKSLGENLVVVTPEQAKGGPLGGYAAASSILLETDLAALRRLPSVLSASAVVMSRAVVAAGPDAVSTTWIGIDAAYLDVARIALDEGEAFGPATPAAAAPLAIVGASVRRRLLGDGDVVGRTITIAGRRLRVVGAARERGHGLAGVDEDDFVLVPKAFARQQLALRGAAMAVDAIFVLARDAQALDATIEDVRAELARTRHMADIRDAISVNSLKGLMATTLQASELLTRLLASLAAISVLVGGVGIVNVMLANIAERRLEVGLKLALGAAPRVIAFEFLAEAVLLALAGAAAGLAVAAVLAMLVTAAHWLDLSLTPAAALLALGLALGTGVAAGAYPASRAAALDPRENLRDA
jgi:putative ABC transport system permease protein